ncbi:hypothetical protein ACTFIU_002108 [Dictyostelium citrinum]
MMMKLEFWKNSFNQFKVKIHGGMMARTGILNGTKTRSTNGNSKNTNPNKTKTNRYNSITFNFNNSTTKFPPSIESPISSPVLINNTETTSSSILSIKDNDNDDDDEPENTTVLHWKLDITEEPLRMRRKEKLLDQLIKDYQNKIDLVGNIVITIVNESPLPIQNTAHKKLNSLMNLNYYLHLKI